MRSFLNCPIITEMPRQRIIWNVTRRNYRNLIGISVILLTVLLVTNYYKRLHISSIWKLINQPATILRARIDLKSKRGTKIWTTLKTSGLKIKEDWLTITRDRITLSICLSWKKTWTICNHGFLSNVDAWINPDLT